MNQMRTFSGRLVDPLNLKVSDIRADDICWALSNICRFGGHCHAHFSVGEHSINVAGTTPDRNRLAALLHDASEAYLGDMPTPLKRRLPAFVEAERRAQRVIADAFGLDPDDFLAEIEEGDVKSSDSFALRREQTALWDGYKIGMTSRPFLVAQNLFDRLKIETPHRLHAGLGLNKAHILS